MHTRASGAAVLRKLCFRVLFAYPLAGGIAGMLASAVLFWPLEDRAGLLLCLLYGVAFGVPAGLAAGIGIVAPLWHASLFPSSAMLILGVAMGAIVGDWFQPDHAPILLWFAVLGFLVAFILLCGALLVKQLLRGRHHDGSAVPAC